MKSKKLILLYNAIKSHLVLDSRYIIKLSKELTYKEIFIKINSIIYFNKNNSVRNNKRKYFK
jgi:hypothetical protein